MECSLTRIVCVGFLMMSAAAVATPFDSVTTISKRDFYQQSIKADGSGEKALVSNPGSLLMEIGPEMLAPNYIFGGVVTAVNDPTHEDMGNLKGSKFPSLMSRLSYDSVNNVLNILACVQNCQDQTNYETAYQVPVLKADPATNRLTVDFSKISGEIDFVSYWVQAMGMHEQHQKLGSRINLVESGNNALVFEIESAYHRALATAPYDYTVKTRWYMKLADAFSPTFVSRFPTNGIGYFLTTGNQPPVKITRYALDKPVHFYIKNVPPRYRKAFSDALEDWNATLLPSLHKRVIDYEFLETTDPRYKSIVTGDIRYSVIEWDLDNMASYGGLGPSVAHPITGETFSSIVWIQGPTIEKMYSHWFSVSNQIQSQKALGNDKGAADILQKFYASLPGNKQKLAKDGTATKVDFPALQPELWDPIAIRDDFELPPTGYTYDQYMYGYFREMVEHEVGHNLGLRHNFRGNLGSDNSGRVGTMSRSVMEYLGKSFRYLDKIGAYDLMAINYGYNGTMPDHTDWYCTDEDQFSSTNPKNSAECSSTDATNDPYSYLEKNVEKVYVDLIAPGTSTTSVWTIQDLGSILQKNLEGMIAYAISAADTSSQWTNFFRSGRPTAASDIPNYVLSRVQARLCPANEAQFIMQKTSAADQTTTRSKIADYRKAALALLMLYKTSPVLQNSTQLNCLASPIQ